MDATKESIMTAAMRLFAEKGLKLVTVREICKAAKVNVALINYHFRNKNGLYQACVERLFHESTGEELCALDAAVSDARSWRAAVRGWIFGVSRALMARGCAGLDIRRFACVAGHSGRRCVGGWVLPSGNGQSLADVRSCAHTVFHPGARVPVAAHRDGCRGRS